MTKYYTNENENEENHKQQQQHDIGSPIIPVKNNKTTILGMSRRFPHTNSPLRSKGSKSTSKNNNGSSLRNNMNTNSKQQQRQHNINSNSTQQLGLQNVQDRDDKISPTSLARHATDESPAEYSWSNNGNGVYSPSPTQHKTAQLLNIDGRQPASPPNLNDDNANDIAYSSSRSPSSYTTRTGLQQRRFNNNNSNNNGTSPSTKEYFAMLSPDTNRSNCPPLSLNQIRPAKVHVSIMTKHRLLILSAALGLACLGYIVEIRQVLLNGGQWNVSSTRSSSSNSNYNGEWLMNLPTSLPPPNHQEVKSENFAFNDNIVAAQSRYLDDEVPVHINIDMQAERKRVQSSLKHRAEQRRLRTKPPSVYPTVVPEASTAEEEETEGKLESFTPPHLTLDLPAHRVLNNGNTEESGGRRLNENNNINKSVHRRLQQIDNPQPQQQQQQQQYPPICGIQAQEASQMNPNNYPPSAHIGPRSRVVITGVLSQVGMELVLQLYEQCGVTVIIGIDSSYPNTRHDRVDMIESRYKYLQRRVPGFQRLMVPVFGIHPHPKIGEEIRFESMVQSFDLVSRLKPSHIVHLAGMEEGHGEHINYGDVVDASPFSDGGKSAMMRRFESMLSMEQVFKSVSNGKTSQPQVVYISSNEAENMSGVSSMHSNTNGSTSPAASVYGTSSLVKEVLASFYYFHYGVDSVGLRVPNVFGPFSRPGSLMYDLVERSIRNAAEKGTEDVPKYHLDRDRYDLLNIAAKREGAMSGAQEQVAFVYDVASAIVAALQFKKDYTNLEIDPNGPMLFRIGSKLTTSMEEMKDRLETLIPPHDENYEAWPTTDRALTLLNNNVPGISTRDTERNWNLLGWSHKSSLQDSTKTMLAWQILKAYPYGLKETVPTYSRFQDLLEDSLATLSYHSLPCASGCRWQGEMCSDSPWDAVIETTKEITQTCPYVLYTVDLRPELEVLEKQSSPSGRQGWEQWFCKIAFVSSSSKLTQLHYASELSSNDPMDEWNGTNKQGQWIIVAVPGTQYSMPEYERSMAKLSPTNLFNERVEKAMYVNHRRVILTTDQAVGVMQHLEMKERKSPEMKTIVDEKTKENVDIWLPPHPHRHSVFFTNKYSFEEGYDTNSVKNLARFVMQSAGIAETKDIRAQVQFYEQTAHLVRTNMQRSPNYQEFNQENLFPYDFLRSTWLLHELNSEEGRNLRCEMYDEHSLWGNAEMEDMSMGYVLARRKVKMQLGQMIDNKGTEEWFPLLEPKDLDDEDVSADGPVLDYLEASQKVSTDSKGHEYYISFLPQKLK